MFDNSDWHVRDGNLPARIYEKALSGLLRSCDAATADDRLELAEKLISQSDFTAEEAAAWRARFADRLAELQPASQKAA